MQDKLKKMPEKLAAHIADIMHINGFDKDDSSKQLFIDSWLKKKALFDKIVEHHGFHLVPRLDEGFTEGIIAVTYSGSLVTLTPQDENGNRELVYNSIGIRKDVVQTTVVKETVISLPLEIHKSIIFEKGKIKKTSPVLAIAIEEEATQEKIGIKKRFRMIGERISKTLLTVNKALFSKNTRPSGLDERMDLFKQWTILSWFRIGGWEEEVFYVRAKLLWLELFSKSYNDISEKLRVQEETDRILLLLSNTHFPEYIDVYKWIESEKKSFDIGLMKALEQIPGRSDYKDFLDKKTTCLLRNVT